MSDNLNSAVLASSKERRRPRMDAMLAELEAINQAPAVTPQAQPSAPAKAPKETSPGVASEAMKAVAGGVTDAARHTWNAIDDAATWLDNNFLDLRIGSPSFGSMGGARASLSGQVTGGHKESLQIPALVSENQTTGGQIARSVTQFVTPFLGAVKALRYAAPAMGRAGAAIEGSAAVRGATAGAAVDFAAFDPTEKRLSNLLLDFTDGNPAIGRPILEYLAADPADSRMEGRFKNTLEGLGVGAAVEGVFKGVKAVKAHYAAKGKSPVEALQEAKQAPQDLDTPAYQRRQATAGKEDLTNLAVDTSKAPDMALADQINLITGVSGKGPSKFQKALDMKAALADAEKAKGIDYTPTKAPEGAAEGLTLAPKEAIPFEKSATGSAEVSFPEQWKLVEEDPTPRKVFLDGEEGAIVVAREGTPKQLDLDLVFPEALKKAERSADDEAVLKVYKELQEKALESVPEVRSFVGKDGRRYTITHDASKGEIRASDEAGNIVGELDAAPLKGYDFGPDVPSQAAWMGVVEAHRRNGLNTAMNDIASEAIPGFSRKSNMFTPEGQAWYDSVTAVKKSEKDLVERIAAAQKRVDDLLEQGKDTTTAQRVLDGLLRKADQGLFDSASRLTAKAADGLATNGDPLVDAIAANNEKLLAAYGRQQGGMITPSMLANLASAQVGAVTGYLSAEDDATFSERLSFAGVGALAGLGVKAGLSKVLTPAERAFIKSAPEEVRSMARPEVANIAPLAATQKKLPVIHTGKVEKLVEAAKSGGMEALSKAVKESDFNFAHIDTQDEVKATIDAFSAVFEKETSLAKHGTQSFADMKELADELGSGVSSLKELYHGTENLGARILAHRALLTASAEQTSRLAKLAMSGDSEGILALRKQVALHATLQAQMKGVQTEVARALSQFRIQSSSLDLAINERNQLIEAMGGHAANIRFAQQLSDITDPKKLNAVIRKGAMARTQDALFEAWVNGLLSGPATHVVNTIGNGLVAIGSVAERAVASGIGKVLRGGTDAISGGEVKAQLFGMVEGLKDSLSITAQGLASLKRAGGEAVQGNFGAAKEAIASNADEFGNAWKAMASDMPVLDNAAYGTREFDLQSAAISAEHFGLDQASILGKTADTLGAIVRTPGRLLTTTDEVFKTIHYRGELKAQAYRMATAEGLRGDALFERVAHLVDNPTPELAAMSLNAAREGTFTAPLGKQGAAVTNAINAVPAARYIMPFIRTPTNILKYVGTRTPGLNLLAESVRADFAAGGIRRDLAMARTSMGASLYAVGAYLAAQGLIVGGGERDKAAEKLGGQQPYSLKIGDTYYSFSRTDPFGMFLGLSADIADISGHIDQEEAGELAVMASLALQRNLVSKSYLSGLVEFIDMIHNPEQSAASWGRSMAGSVVPAAVNAVRREEDPVVREVWTAVDAIKNRIPGFSKDLPPMLNLFGEEVTYKGGVGPDIASPFTTSVASSDRAASEIARLNIDLRHPPRTFGSGIDLTPQQYHRLVRIMGAEVGEGGFKGALDRLLDDDAYQALSESPEGGDYMGGKEKAIRDTYAAYKRAAFMQLVEEDEDVRAKFLQDRQNQGRALSGEPVLPF